MLMHRCGAQHGAVVQTLIAKMKSVGTSKLQSLGEALGVGEGGQLGQVVAALAQGVEYSTETMHKLCKQLNTANATDTGGVSSTPAVTGNTVEYDKQTGSVSSSGGSSKPSDSSGSKQNGASSSSSSSKAYQLFEEQSPASKCETLPLHKAAQYGYADTVGILLAGGADPNYRCCHGYSPLLQVNKLVWRFC